MDKLTGSFNVSKGNLIMLDSVILTLSKEQMEEMSKKDYSAGNVQFFIQQKEDGTLQISA